MLVIDFNNYDGNIKSCVEDMWLLMQCPKLKE